MLRRSSRKASKPSERRKGKKARTTADKNLKLKPMRTLAPILRCDPQRLERIRCKEKANKETAQHLSSSSRDPMGVELAEEYRSTPSAASIMARSPTIQLSRANEIQITKDNLKRKDFDKQIQQDIERQAARPGKTTRTCEERPNHAKTNLGSIGGDLHNQCDKPVVRHGLLRGTRTRGTSVLADLNSKMLARRLTMKRFSGYCPGELVTASLLRGLSFANLGVRPT